MCASRSSDLKMDDQDLKRTLDILAQTEKKMPLTFSGVGKSAMASTLGAVMAEVAIRKKVTFEELMSIFYYDADKWTMDKIVQTMEAMRFVKIGHEGERQVIVYQKEGGDA